MGFAPDLNSSNIAAIIGHGSFLEANGVPVVAEYCFLHDLHLYLRRVFNQ